MLEWSGRSTAEVHQIRWMDAQVARIYCRSASNPADGRPGGVNLLQKCIKSGGWMPRWCESTAEVHQIRRMDAQVVWIYCRSASNPVDGRPGGVNLLQKCIKSGGWTPRWCESTAEVHQIRRKDAQVARIYCRSASNPADGCPGGVNLLHV